MNAFYRAALTIALVVAVVSAFRFPISDLQAAPVAYSGKLTVNGFAHDGPGHFRFQLVDHNGSVLWSNSADGAAVTTAVNRGHYSVLLGDDATPHMAAIPPNLFLDHPVVFLRVHFSQGDGKPFVHLQPDQRILSAAHALTADKAEEARRAQLAEIAEKVKAGAITLDMLSAEVLAELNATQLSPGVVTRDMLAPGVLADLNASIANGSITPDMLSPAVLAQLNPPLVITRGDLPPDVLADLNKTITRSDLPPDVLADLNRIITRNDLPADVLADLNRTIAITREMLPGDVLADLNRTVVITRNMLPGDVLADLNRTVVITRNMLPGDVLADLNRTVVITRDMLPGNVLADLNRTITRSMLAPGVRQDLNRTITRNMLPGDVLADINASITLGRLSPEVLAALGVLPSISTQPFALYDGATNTARFEVSGRGHALSYQWLKDGQPINGATTPVLEIANALLDDNATYAVRITNSLGEANSQTLTLQDAIGAPGHPLAEANATAVPRAGLVLWMDALDLNADGHADNVLLGDRISSWTDKITDKNATQAEWGNQPVKTANGVSFDGNDDFLKITDLNVTAQHIFIVAKRRPKSSWINLISGKGNNNAKWYNSGGFYADGGTQFAVGTGGSVRVSAGPNSLTDNVTFVATLTVGDEGSDNGVFLDLSLGSNSGGGGANLDGEIHEVLFYDRLLQNSERDAVEQHLAQKWGITLYPEQQAAEQAAYDAAKPPAEPENGLVAYYKFEPVSGSNWTNKVWDYSGNDRHLTMSNFDDDPWAEGVAGDALAFDGLNDKANSSGGVFNFNLKTIAFWAKPDVAVDGREDPNYVFEFEQSGVIDFGFAFNHTLRGGSGHWILSMQQSGNTPWPTVETNATFDQDFQGWFHVAMVATQPDGTPSYDFYANGNKLDTISTDPKTGFLKSSHGLKLGYYESSYYKGFLDEFRIYDRILAPAEIETLFNSYQNPIVHTDGEHNATVGTNFSLSLTADNGPTTYLAEGLPAGLSLNVVTGEISGTLSQPGYHRVFVKAMNEHGTGSSTIAIVARPQTDENGWPVDVPDGSAIPQNGIVLWLDANDVDADGQIDSGTDHLKLANWADKAGHDHNATQATAFRQPEIRANQLPERPGLNLLRFDGNQSLALPTLSNGRTFFWVVNRGAGSDGSSAFFSLNDSYNWSRIIGGSIWSNPSSYIINGLQHRNGENINGATPGAFLMDLQVISLRTTDFQPADLIGEGFHNSTHYFTGNIGEILAYDRALTESEIETVEKYLGQKWGISISHDATPPVAGDPPTFQVSPAAGSVTAAMLTDEVKTFLAPRMVTQPPAQVTGYAERSIHIPAVADGRQLSYQWQRAGQPVAGATSPILHLADLNASTDPGSYSLVVTNPFGSVTSSATQLTVATVVPNDVDLPVLTLNGQKSISLLTGTAWQDPGFSATDDLDGNLTAVVDVNGTVDVATPGAYFITYKATDSAGNFATAQRVVTVSNFTDLCLIPAGTFLMGQPNAVPPSGATEHEVYLSAFYVGKYEVTKTIWDEVYNWATDPARGANVYQFDNNGTAEGPDHPVVNVSWYDMIKWCNARSEKDNLQPLYYSEANQSTIYRTGNVSLTNAHVNWQANGWRLPTEAEWEKAAKGGLVGMAYPHGNQYSPAFGNVLLSAIGKTVPVGNYPANGYGLHDTFGNVAEQLWDGYQQDWYLQPEASLPNPRGGENFNRVSRGSNYTSDWVAARIYYRTIGGSKGFRLARNAPDAVAGGYPTLTSSPDANGTAGQAFSYQITAGNSPAAYGATGLPAGLSVNVSTGLISGTAPTTAVGEHNATISATNAAGTTSMSLSLVVFGTHVAPSAANLEMIWVEPGTFTMGSPATETGRASDETEHNVTLTQGFYLGKYEVTQAQYEAVIGTNPSEFNATGNGNRPVEKVTWTEATQFCATLTTLEQNAGRLPADWAYVLPTEAQLEYACRAGTTTIFSWGNTATSTQANFDGTGPYGGAATGPNLQQTTDVGSYGANPWGFFDMHGNVWEWCSDWKANYPSGPLTDPTGAASGSLRVSRCGSWYWPGNHLRSAKRNDDPPGNRYSDLGFRVGFRFTGQ